MANFDRSSCAQRICSAKTLLAAAVAAGLSATLAAHAKPARLDIGGWMQADNADPAAAPKWDFAVRLEEGESERVSLGEAYPSLSVDVTLVEWDESVATVVLKLFDEDRLISAPRVETRTGVRASLTIGIDAEYVVGVSVKVSGD